MTARHWAFIVGKPFLPDHTDPCSAGLGGTEQAIINLTTALAALGDTVTVVGGSCLPRTLHGVSWNSGAFPQADIVVAINDARLLPLRALRPTIWFHNEVNFSREMRRGRLPAIMRARPHAVFIGNEQARAASRLLPFSRRSIIPYGLSDRILSAPGAIFPPAATALFTSQAYRGLKGVLAWWQSDITPALPSARLEALIAATDIAGLQPLCTAPGVTLSPRVGNDAVLARLLQTRVLIAPGHVSETFCLAAAEAIALGVPVVTLGIGSLKERIRSGIDGFICRTDRDMAARTLELLMDDALWCRMHEAGLGTRAGRSWTDVAQTWRSRAFGSEFAFGGA